MIDDGCLLLGDGSAYCVLSCEYLVSRIVLWVVGIQVFVVVDIWWWILNIGYCVSGYWYMEITHTILRVSWSVMGIV